MHDNHNQENNLEEILPATLFYLVALQQYQFSYVDPLYFESHPYIHHQIHPHQS